MCCEELPEALERISFQIACRRRATQVTPAQIAPVDVLNDEYDGLVQVLFELVQGERIPLFAKKLARRLERLGLFTKVRTIVAINALYQDAPVELLGEERQRRALERLCAKDQLHFRINLDATGTPCGVRLAHVHLAWLLFQEWADTDGITTIEQAWAAELDRALTSHLEWGRDVQAGSLLYQLLISARLHDEPEVKPNRIDTIREIDCTWRPMGARLMSQFSQGG